MDIPNVLCQEHLRLNKSIQFSEEFSQIFLFNIPLILINILPVTPIHTLWHFLFTPSSPLAFTSDPSHQALAVFFQESYSYL